MSPVPSLSLVDTHCHLNLDDFDHDRLQVVERARANGVQRILIPGIDVETSRSAIKYAHQIPEAYAAIGVHPNSALGWTKEALVELKQLAGEGKVVAIGEIGLDYYRNFAPRQTQQAIFLQQLELAAALKLPVVVHNRDASDDIRVILTDWMDKLSASGSQLTVRPGVLHSFSAGVEMAHSMANQHFSIGITGPVTYRNAHELQSVVTSVPLECLLIETDAPYLPPQPYRGKRNEPANVRIVAEKIAELCNQPIELVASITSASADRLFDWRELH